MKSKIFSEILSEVTPEIEAKVEQKANKILAMKDKEKYFIDLRKCSEAELKNIYTVLGDTLKFISPSIVFNFPIMHYHEGIWIRTNYFQDKAKEDNFLEDKTELAYPEFIKLFEGGESKEDFAIYKRTFNKIPYPRVEWECNCGFKHCLNEGFEQDYRKDNFKEIRLPTGKCLKCKKEIRTQSLEIKEVLQVENKHFDREFILCASLKFHDNIVSGHRHSDCYELIRKMCPNIADTSLPQREDQGFLTSLNRHVDRREGWKIAKENNQIKWGLNASNDNEESQLISENLY